MRDQLTGAAAFHLSDIERSTRHWETHREQMNAALLHHDEILRNLIEANNGHIFKTVDDGGCVAFAADPIAIRRSLEIQPRIRAQPCEMPSPLRVRIALHTGDTELRGNDCFGRPLNRIAPIESLAHGL